MPTTWRAFSGEGYSALTMQPLGALTLIGASEPWLFGCSGLRQLRTANVE